MVCNFEIHIVSHYRQDRENQLNIIFNAFSGWKDSINRLVLTSNRDHYADSEVFKKWAPIFKSKGDELILNVVNDLPNPRHLAWEHKKFLKNWIKNASKIDDYFMYIEDDLEITNENKNYLIDSFPILKKHNLLPGFVRYEKEGSKLKAIDVWREEYWQRERSIKIDGQVWHANINPYCASYVLDHHYASEYIESKSFDLAESEFVDWGTVERSAMGLTFENPMSKLRSRVVVPITNGTIAEKCLIWHCSNNYTAANHPLIGAHEVHSMYKQESNIGYIQRNLYKIKEKLFPS